MPNEPANNTHSFITMVIVCTIYHCMYLPTAFLINLAFKQESSVLEYVGVGVLRAST